MAPDGHPEIVRLFVELAAIPSPPGQERIVAEWVRQYLRRIGLEVDEDNAGNLLTRVEPEGKNEGTPIFLCAHLDTVPPSGPIHPVVIDGVIRNAGGTILGADNKASIVAILEAVTRLRNEQRQHSGLDILFTVCEEDRLGGAKAFDPRRLQASVGFVYDHAGPIGDVVMTAPHHRAIDAIFTGRAAHAGIDPGEGRSAVHAAARAIAALRLGQVDSETTVNVGRIEGGTARNIVPDRCAIVAEARSRNQGKLEDVVIDILNSFALAAAATGCEVATSLDETYDGYSFHSEDYAVRLAFAALERAGFQPRSIEAGGGADANVFNARGLACVNLANGMTKIHTPEEQIAVADLEGMVDVTLALIEVADGSAWRECD